MNGRVTKKLRQLFNPKSGDEISKKAYKKSKKHWKTLSDQEKKEFIKNLETVQQSNK